jgi:cytochrome P450
MAAKACPAGRESLPKTRTATPRQTDSGIFYSETLGCWIVQGYADAVAAMREPALEIPRLPLPAEFLSSEEKTGLTALWEQAECLPLYSTGKAHQRLRRGLRAPFTKDAVNEWRPLIRRIVNELIKGLPAASVIDVVEDVGRPLLRRVMAEVIGIPPDRRSDFDRWANATVDAGKLATPEWSGHIVAEVTDALQSIDNLIRELLTKPEQVPPRSVLAYAAAQQGEPGCPSQRELAANARALYTAGAHTTIFLIAAAACMIFGDNVILEEVRRDAEVVADVVQETLRFACPAVEVNVRRATRDVSIGAQKICQGEFVRIAVLPASRDSGHFRDPDVFDHHRRRQGRILAYGAGPHVCLGNHLATAITEETCAVLADPRYSARLVAPYPEFRRRPALPVMWGPDWLYLELGPA